MLSAKAKFPTNKLIVNPMPVKIAIPYNLIQFEFEGISASFNFTEIYENRKTPICLPKNKPHKIPRGTGFVNVLIDIPSKETPAFAKAKCGIIPKATYGDKACSSFNNNDKSLSLFLCGMLSANKTPDIVECIPDSWVKYQRRSPIIK